jgi:hypothetical protein
MRRSLVCWNELHLPEGDAMNWDDPTARFELIERVGPTEYNRLHREHIEASTIERVNGYAIRPIETMRFGRVYQVGDTGSAFSTIEAARKYAESIPDEC